MDEIQAAVLCVKLQYLDVDNQIRKKAAQYYYDNICNPMISLPLRIDDSNNIYHIFPVFCERRNELQHYLAEKGIETMIHYPIPSSTGMLSRVEQEVISYHREDTSRRIKYAN